MVDEAINNEKLQVQLPIFHQKWWLDIVAENSWKYLLCLDRNAIISAVLPISITKNKVGLSQIINPSLTPYLGPYILNPPTGKIHTQISTIKKIYTNLISQVPECGFFQQYFSDQVLYPLPFFWHNFDFKLFYTYQLSLTQNDNNQLWNGLSTNTRKNIKKAKRLLTVTEYKDPEIMWQALNQTCSRQNLSLPCSYDVLHEIILQSIEKKSGVGLCAVDKYEKVHASTFIVWDQSKAYYLLADADQELRSSGASSLLLWEAITLASRHVGLFDFYGSTIESIEKFVRGFGGKPVPILVCVKKSPQKKMYDVIRKNQVIGSVTKTLQGVIKKIR